MTVNKGLEAKKAYKESKRKKVLVIISFLLILLIAVVVSVSLGAASPGFAEAARVIIARVFPFLGIDPGSKLAQVVILDLRLPRVLMAILAGAGLAASGATIQGVLRNPLVSSYTLGISAAAGFGSALALVFGIGVLSLYGVVGSYVVIANAFLFSLLATVLVYGIARVRGTTRETLILAGVAIGFLFSAMLSLIQYVVPNVIFWLMGGLDSASWEGVLIVFPIVLVTTILMVQQSWNINVMSMGEEVATSLGVSYKRILNITMVLETLATASIISFTGVIGFVDLISPHIARMLIGSDHRFLIPFSALVGALILLCSDTVARLVLRPVELPVGIVTSLLGVPFFIYILVNRRRQLWR